MSRWKMLLCKNLNYHCRNSFHIAMQRVRTSFMQPRFSCWCQCVVARPEPRRLSESVTAVTSCCWLCFKEVGPLDAWFKTDLLTVSFINNAFSQNTSKAIGLWYRVLYRSWYRVLYRIMISCSVSIMISCSVSIMISCSVSDYDIVFCIDYDIVFCIDHDIVFCIDRWWQKLELFQLGHEVFKAFTNSQDCLTSWHVYTLKQQTKGFS